MQKVIIIGCPGSGKSTFAKKLHQITQLPLIHLDNLNWNKDKTNVSKEVFMERLTRVLSLDSWIIDGNYGSSMEQRIQHCDTIIFLDYPTNVCIEGITERIGKKRDDAPWIETELDLEFFDFVTNFNMNNRESIINLLNKYNDKNILIFKNRNEASTYLNQLNKEC